MEGREDGREYGRAGYSALVRQHRQHVLFVHVDAGMQDTQSLSDSLDEHERSLILSALAAASGNVAEASRRLKTDRANLYRRMRRLSIPIGEN